MVARVSLRILGQASYKFMNLKLIFLFNGNVAGCFFFFSPGLFSIRTVCGFHLGMLF